MIGRIKGHGDKTTYWLDGRQVNQEEFERAIREGQSGGGVSGEGGQTPGSSLIGFKPIHSESLGVHPRQAKKAQESALAKGVPTEFDDKGRPIFTSRLHRKQYCQAYGFFDRDAGYGDAQRQSSRTKVDESEIRKQYHDLIGAAPAPERGNVTEAVRAVLKRHGL